MLFFYHKIQTKKFSKLLLLHYLCWKEFTGHRIA